MTEKNPRQNTGQPRPERRMLTMEEARARAEKGYQRLLARGRGTRDIEGRLAWKRARGIDTTLEERYCGLNLR